MEAPMMPVELPGSGPMGPSSPTSNTSYTPPSSIPSPSFNLTPLNYTKPGTATAPPAAFQNRPNTIRRKAPPPPRKILATAIALYDFEPEEEGGEELTFKEGDQLEIVEKTKELEEDGWCKARLKGTRKIGLAPLEYLEVTETSKPAMAIVPEHSQEPKPEAHPPNTHSAMHPSAPPSTYPSTHPSSHPSTTPGQQSHGSIVSNVVAIGQDVQAVHHAVNQVSQAADAVGSVFGQKPPKHETPAHPHTSAVQGAMNHVSHVAHGVQSIANTIHTHSAHSQSHHNTNAPHSSTSSTQSAQKPPKQHSSPHLPSLPHMPHAPANYTAPSGASNRPPNTSQQGPPRPPMLGRPPLQPQMRPQGPMYGPGGPMYNQGPLGNQTLMASMQLANSATQFGSALANMDARQSGGQGQGGQSQQNQQAYQENQQQESTHHGHSQQDYQAQDQHGHGNSHEQQYSAEHQAGASYENQQPAHASQEPAPTERGMETYASEHPAAQANQSASVEHSVEPAVHTQEQTHAEAGVEASYVSDPNAQTNQGTEPSQPPATAEASSSTQPTSEPQVQSSFSGEATFSTEHQQGTLAQPPTDTSAVSGNNAQAYDASVTPAQPAENQAVSQPVEQQPSYAAPSDQPVSSAAYDQQATGYDASASVDATSVSPLASMAPQPPATDAGLNSSITDPSAGGAWGQQTDASMYSGGADVASPYATEQPAAVDPAVSPFASETTAAYDQTAGADATSPFASMALDPSVDTNAYVASMTTTTTTTTTATATDVNGDGIVDEMSYEYQQESSMSYEAHMEGGYDASGQIDSGYGYQEQVDMGGGGGMDFGGGGEF